MLCGACSWPASVRSSFCAVELSSIDLCICFQPFFFFLLHLFLPYSSLLFSLILFETLPLFPRKTRASRRVDNMPACLALLAAICIALASCAAASHGTITVVPVNGFDVPS
jgi:hypothetical protein